MIWGYQTTIFGNLKIFVDLFRPVQAQTQADSLRRNRQVPVVAGPMKPYPQTSPVVLQGNTQSSVPKEILVYHFLSIFL